MGHSAARSTTDILISSSVRTGGTTAPAGAIRSAICRIQSTNARSNSAARGSCNHGCSASRTRSTSSNDRLCSTAAPVTMVVADTGPLIALARVERLDRHAATALAPRLVPGVLAEAHE